MKTKYYYLTRKQYDASVKDLDESLATIEKIKKRLNLNNEAKEDLIAFLEEYLILFKNKKEHQKAHKKEPCLKCKLAKELLRKLKR